MKDFSTYITESLGTTNMTLYCPSATVLALYLFEAEGQISDGKYENEDTNWEKWISKIKFVEGDPGYHTRLKHIYPYEFDDIIDIKEIKDRMLIYGKIGKVLGFDALKTLYEDDMHYYIRDVIEDIGRMIAKKASYEDIQKAIEERADDGIFRKRGVPEYLPKVFNENLYQKYLKASYSTSELTSDIKLLDEMFRNRK